MDSRAGYFAPSAWASGASSSSPSFAPTAEASVSAGSDDPAIPRKLTGKQEERLRSYIDDRFTTISRGVAKRHETSGEYRTLASYLEAINSLLDVILNIPLFGVTGALQISYLLRITAAVLEDVPGYFPGGAEEASTDAPHDGPQSASTSSFDGLKSVLFTLEALDRAWYSILFGRQVSVLPLREHSKQSVERALIRRRRRGTTNDVQGACEVDRADQHMARRAVGLSRASRSGTPAMKGDTSSDSDGPSDIEAITSSRYLAVHPPGESQGPSETTRCTNVARDSRPVQGGLDVRTVPQTDRVRLRNILVLGKEPVFAWMRHSLGAPPPPRQIDEVTGTLESSGPCGYAPSSQNNEKFYKMLRPSQHVRDLFVDQGNLNNDLQPREEVLSASESATPPMASGVDDPSGSGQGPTTLDTAEIVKDSKDLRELSAYRSALQTEETDEKSYLNRNAQVILPPQEGTDVPSKPYSGVEAIETAIEGGGDSAEREHYADLFDRKLDPDSDDDSETDEPRLNPTTQIEAGVASGPDPSGPGGASSALDAINQRSASQLGDKRPPEEDDDDQEWEAVAAPTKHARKDTDPFTSDQMELQENEELLEGQNYNQEKVQTGDQEQDETADGYPADTDDVLPPTPSGGKEEHGGNESIGWAWKPLLEWDLAFSKTFHRTLRTLNELDDPRPDA